MLRLILVFAYAFGLLVIVSLQTKTFIEERKLKVHFLNNSQSDLQIKFFLTSSRVGALSYYLPKLIVDSAHNAVSVLVALAGMLIWNTDARNFGTFSLMFLTIVGYSIAIQIFNAIISFVLENPETASRTLQLINLGGYAFSGGLYYVGKSYPFLIYFLPWSTAGSGHPSPLCSSFLLFVVRIRMLARYMSYFQLC